MVKCRNTPNLKNPKSPKNKNWITIEVQSAQMGTAEPQKIYWLYSKKNEM